MSELRARIAEAMETAREASMAGHDRYDAGRYEGLKQALELLDLEARKMDVTIEVSLPPINFPNEVLP